MGPPLRHPLLVTASPSRGVNWPWVPAAVVYFVSFYLRYGPLGALGCLLAAAALIAYVKLRARRQRRRRMELLPHLMGLDEVTALAEIRRAGLVASVFGADTRQERKARRRRHDSERVTLFMEAGRVIKPTAS